MRTTFIATILLASTAISDDRVRDAQAELKTQGFYFGEVDGKNGNETSAAIRRFQIRNGLKVTGDLNPETLNALGFMDDSAAAPTPKPEQRNPPPPDPSRKAEIPGLSRPPVPNETEPPLKPARDFLRRPENTDRTVEEHVPRRLLTDDPNIVPPPAPIPNPVGDAFSLFFQGTPYAIAPREVQIDILRKAQSQLGRRGLYRAVVDGIPGPTTAEALFAYQTQRRLGRTGRLDMATLADMNLLPGRGPDAPALRPFYDPNRRRDRTVDFNSMHRL